MAVRRSIVSARARAIETRSVFMINKTIVAVICCVSFIACSSNDEPGGAPSCAQACSSALSACPELAQLGGNCEANCAGSSASLRSCLASASSCTAVEACEDDTTVDPDAGNADCPSTTCDGNELVVCTLDNGVKKTQRMTCEAGCTNGKCVDQAAVCEPAFREGGASCPSGCGDVSIVVDGKSYCSARCVGGGACPEGTECNTDYNGGTCLPKCGTGGQCPEGFLESTVGSCSSEWCGLN